MSERDVSVLERFKWECQPAGQRFVREQTDRLLSRLPEAADLARRLHEEAAVRFTDMIDTIVLPQGDVDAANVGAAGWTRRSEHRGWTLLDNELGIFPTIAVSEDLPAGSVSMHLKVEFVADFLLAQSLQREIVGEPLARYRFAEIWRRGDFSLAAVERHGHRGMHTEDRPSPADVLQVLESFRMRPRDLPDDIEGFRAAVERIDRGIATIGRAYTCDLWFAAEREYWMRRNLAARVQKARQDRLGIGWANHDHHTYRSSREMFPHLVAVWEKLGFHCRERFYAGLEAGWGAQVMEEPITGVTTFNDVDMSPQELMGDFSHEGFAEKRDRLGTVGLWCALHGEAFLQAGMHHLEAQFDHHLLTRQLESEHGIRTMKPFTSFEYLTQAFTEGERWAVRPQRVDRLLEQQLITPEQAAAFRAEGAIGSHLENLERNDGFKGFNQKGVSEIIAATDPRRQTRSQVMVGA